MVRLFDIIEYATNNKLKEVDISGIRSGGKMGIDFVLIVKTGLDWVEWRLGVDDAVTIGGKVVTNAFWESGNKKFIWREKTNPLN